MNSNDKIVIAVACAACLMVGMVIGWTSKSEPEPIVQRVTVDRWQDFQDRFDDAMAAHKPTDAEKRWQAALNDKAQPVRGEKYILTVEMRDAQSHLPVLFPGRRDVQCYLKKSDEVSQWTAVADTLKDSDVGGTSDLQLWSFETNAPELMVRCVGKGLDDFWAILRPHEPIVGHVQR